MTRTHSIVKISAAALAVSLFSFAPAYAGGSGSTGGGLSNGSSGNPQQVYNPAQDYQDGLGFIKANDFKKADRKFNQVLKAVKRHSGANYYMGVAKAGQGKDKSSIRYFKSCLLYTSDAADE